LISRFGVSRLANYSLKGVQYAAHRSTSYKVGETKAVHGWVYGFAEPYQIFIIYMRLDRQFKKHHENIRFISSSFNKMSFGYSLEPLPSI